MQISAPQAVRFLVVNSTHGNKVSAPMGSRYKNRLGEVYRKDSFITDIGQRVHPEI